MVFVYGPVEYSQESLTQEDRELSESSDADVNNDPVHESADSPKVQQQIAFEIP